MTLKRLKALATYVEDALVDADDFDMTVCEPKHYERKIKRKRSMSPSL